LLDFSAHMLRVDAHERNSQSAATSAMGMVDAGLQADTDALLKAAKATKLVKRKDQGADKNKRKRNKRQCWVFQLHVQHMRIIQTIRNSLVFVYFSAAL